MNKRLIISILFALPSFMKVNAQNGIYIITEKYDGMVSSPPTFDSVYVTSPSGLTTKYSIPNYITNPGGHDSQFSIILNGITSQGYKIITPIQKQGVGNPSLGQPYSITRTLYLAKTWLTSVQDLIELNNSQIKVNVFPNPTLGDLNIEIICSKEFEPNEVVVINQLGIIVFSLPINYLKNRKIEIDVSTLKPGSYLLSVKNKNYYSKTSKFIKQ